MKTIKKENILAKKYIEGTMREKDILLNMKHPFILNLHYCFTTFSHLFILIEYLPGGDLFFHLKKKGNLDEKAAKFYGA